MKPGDKVVCVDGKPGLGHRHYEQPFGLPIEGKIYVIKAFLPKEYAAVLYGWRKAHFDRCVIVGLPCILLRNGLDMGFKSDRFRLLDELKNEARKRRKEGVRL